MIGIHHHRRAPLSTRTSVLNPARRIVRNELLNAAIIFSGSWSGTSRKLTFAVAFAGITVLRPRP